MATYRIDVYAAPNRLVDVHLVAVDKGRDAIWAAHVDINDRHADHADVFMSDGTGSDWFYAAVRNEIEEYDDGTCLYRDDVRRVLLDAMNGPRPEPRPDDMARLLAMRDELAGQIAARDAQVSE
jgi:hypothetical protein